MTALPGQLPLGRSARLLWTLHDDGSFLNHGSYGAVPRVVQQAQQRLRDEMESHPDAFMHRVEPLAGGAIREVAATLATMTGTSADRVAMVENATSGVQAVLNSLPFQHGDQILLTDHQYNAVRLAVDARCRQTGAEAVVVRIPLPTDADQIVERVLAAAGPRVRFALLDHITSPTALVFPVQRLATELRRRGIPLFVDGAHAIGQVPLDLPSIGADWYVTNLHKWLYAPKGTAMLYASGGAAPLTWPLVTSHYLELGSRVRSTMRARATTPPGSPRPAHWRSTRRSDQRACWRTRLHWCRPAARHWKPSAPCRSRHRSWRPRCAPSSCRRPARRWSAMPPK